MILVTIRTIIIYFLVLIVMRFMGKREIGQMQSFEFVISMMIANLASTPMSDIGIPIFYAIIPIIGLLIMHKIITLGNIKSMKFREIMCGRPTILIYRGKIIEQELVNENITINELQERLRAKDINNIGEVEFAILETSGQVSVVQKPEYRALKPQDFNMVPDYEGISYDLVIDGKVMYENLKKIGKEYNWLKQEVNKFGYNPEDALIVVQNGDESIYSQKKEL